ncbi:hypothetical protein [Roseicyclus marinus]|uniref:hypothetical protein n=1 Tax=Roseicyclus marinus TaxID=2161673 RepID=UPI0024103EF5|nr:hypothetical protein [Roseicyclus marinus]MDG3041914.1 hypothetical protein [Roseicyclus marinus]
MRFVILAAILAASPAAAQNEPCEAVRDLAMLLATSGTTVLEAAREAGNAASVDRLLDGETERMAVVVERATTVATTMADAMEQAMAIVQRSGCVRN